VGTFLESCKIELPPGAPEDCPDIQSMCALGNRNDQYFMQHLAQDGVESYEASIALGRKIREQELGLPLVNVPLEFSKALVICLA
jgi:hypothetical protein